MQKTFGYTLPVPILLNSRLKRTLGRLISQTHISNGKTIVIRIELAKIIINSDYATTLDVLHKLLIHYHVTTEGTPKDIHQNLFDHICWENNLDPTIAFLIEHERASMIDTICHTPVTLDRISNNQIHTRSGANAYVINRRDVR